MFTLFSSVKTRNMISYCIDEYNYAFERLAGLLDGPVS